eukprot:scaffold2117_cov241-Pinguiococcus_pyrenoidosus.AAC.17
MMAALPQSDCRYVVYDHDFVTHDGRKTSKMYFISWMPSNATRHNKMAYSEMKQTVSTRFAGTFDVQAQESTDILLALGVLSREDLEEEDQEFEDDF